MSCSSPARAPARWTPRSQPFQKGDKVITVNGGKFGERWTKIAKAYGLTRSRSSSTPATRSSPRSSKKSCKRIPTRKRGSLSGFRDLDRREACRPRKSARIARKARMLSVCDAITACGVFDLPMDDWGIDVLITGSQKALMLPPGLAMIALSDEPGPRTRPPTFPDFTSTSPTSESLAKNQTAWTPAISLIQGLQESLRMIREEGLHNVFKRHELLARATRAGVQALGLELLAKKSPFDRRDGGESSRRRSKTASDPQAHARQVRRHDRRRPGRARRQDHPAFAFRLLRPIRHHHRRSRRWSSR